MMTAKQLIKQLQSFPNTDCEIGILNKDDDLMEIINIKYEKTANDGGKDNNWEWISLSRVND